MAVDAWLLDQHLQGLQPPMLRFYTWQPIAISLGCHQRQFPNRWLSQTWQGQPVDLVRRPTGGRAVLHQGDLTYAIVLSGLTGTRQAVYQTICRFLEVGWRQMGVQLHYGSANRGYAQNPNCFGAATIADLVMASGAKLIGSAQLRRGTAILQHGSIRLNPDPDLIAAVFGSMPALLPELPANLQQLAAIGQVTQAIIENLTAAASACFSADFQVQPLCDREWAAIQQNSDFFSVT